MHSSHETADPRLVEALTGEAPDAIARLERFGVEFTRDATAATGSPAAAAPRASGCCRSATAPATRSRPRCARRSQLGRAHRDARPRAARRPRAGARRAGARRSSRAQGARSTVEAGAVVLAAGGRCFAEAKRLGDVLHERRRRDRRGHARSRSPPAARRATSTRCSTTPTAASGPVACRATRSPRRRAPTARSCSTGTASASSTSSAPRDVVAAAIVRECEEGRGLTTPDGRPSVLLDCRPIAAADAAISLPYMLRRYRAAGIDPLAEPIHTYPVLHYQNGGLVIDARRRRRPWPGLFAAGEITGGVHGRNRMMGNSLLDGCGLRLARRAAAPPRPRLGSRGLPGRSCL